MADFPTKDIGSWICDQYKSLNPDIVIPTGNRIFNLLFLLQKYGKEFKEIFQKIADTNAIHYMDCDNKCIMLIDEETEYGRKFLIDIFPHFKEIFPKSVNCFTIFLRDDVKAQNKRKDYIQKWKEMNSERGEIANCLQSIKSYKAYDDSEKFHQAIFNFKDFIKSNLKKPYNMDATLFRISSDKGFSELENKLSDYGNLFWYDENTFILIPNFFDVERYNNIGDVRIKEGTLPKLRFFRSDDGSLIVSPMVYFPIQFTSDKPVFDKEAVVNNHPLLYQIFKVWLESNKISPNNKIYFIQLYDLLIFYLDIELFRNFVCVVEGAGIDFKSEMEEYCCMTHYGKILGNKLLKIIRRDVVHSPQLSLNLYSKTKYDIIDSDNIDCNVATLLSIRAACLEQYRKSQAPFKRKGLTFSSIQEQLKLDPFSTTICIDLLCDNASLKPFDKVVSGLQVARFYNTDIEDFIGVFTKLLWRAKSEGIPMGKTNLAKFTTFLDYFAIAINEKYNHYPIKIVDAPEGKVINVIDDEKVINDRLQDIFTVYPKYSEIFDFNKKKHQFEVKDKTPRTLEHLDIVESEAKLDSYLDIIFTLYKKLQNYLDEHPEIVDSKGNRRTIYDVFPGLIELLGPVYPEGGLKIVGSLTKRALYYYEKYLNGESLRDGKDPKKEAEFLLFHAIPHKIEMYQKFSEAYLECYKYLSDPYISRRRDVWKNMCVWPPNSLILEFCNKIISYIQKEIKSLQPQEIKSLQLQKLKNLKGEVDEFLKLMTDCSIKSQSQQSNVQRLPANFANSQYIVFIDLKNSTKISELKDPRWESIVSYFINIMCKWATAYHGKLINFPEGDGIIVAFQDISSARSFAAGCCTQVSEISESINQCATFGNYTTGCYGQMTYGLVRVNENNSCISDELSIMCKYMPKEDGKIVIDAKTIEECRNFPDAEFIEKEGRSYCMIDSKSEFKNMILARF